MIKFLALSFVVFILTIVLLSSPFRTKIISSNPHFVEMAYKLGVSGDPTASCCDVSKILAEKGTFDDKASVAIFEGKQVNYPKTTLATIIQQNIDPNSAVLGTTNAAGEEKWIDVSLDTQTLKAYEGDKVVLEFPISSGRWSPTPTGTFNIWYKTKSQSMIGGSQELGTYYNLPNVPSNMFFNGGYAIHGAYWHNNFGHPMSHGCVNAPLDKVAELFNWTGPVVPENQNVIRASAENPGTKVYVH